MSDETKDSAVMENTGETGENVEVMYEKKEETPRSTSGNTGETTQNTPPVSLWSSLPPELLHHIVSYLDLESVERVGRVCRRWEEAMACVLPSRYRERAKERVRELEEEWEKRGLFSWAVRVYGAGAKKSGKK